MSNKLTFEEWSIRQHQLCRNTKESCLDKKCVNCDYGVEARQAWNFCQAQEQKEIEELKKKVEELESRDINKMFHKSMMEIVELKKKLETCQECDYDNCKGCKLFEGE